MVLRITSRFAALAAKKEALSLFCLPLSVFANIYHIIEFASQQNTNKKRGTRKVKST